MVERELIIYSIYFVLFVLIMLIGLMFFIIQYRKAKKQEILEKEMIEQRHAKELLSTRLDIQQKTMTDIGRELHDNIGQKLTLASIYTQQLEHTSTSEQNTQLNEIITILNETLQDVREVSKTLTNANVEKKSLHQLITKECNKVLKTSKCKIDYKNEIQEEDFPLNQKLVLIRIIQEFIQNSLKYSNCEDIFVNIYSENNKKYIILKDNGIGFDLERTLEEGSGIGLQNIQNRANLIGAKLEMRSKLSEGTIFKIVI